MMKWFLALQSVVLVSLIVVSLGKFSKAEDLWAGEERQHFKKQLHRSELDELRREQMQNSLLTEEIVYGRQYSGTAVFLLTLGCGLAAVTSVLIALSCHCSARRKATIGK